jgi:hypothetical protein
MFDCTLFKTMLNISVGASRNEMMYKGLFGFSTNVENIGHGIVIPFDFEGMR